ncbi:MAG TPA: 2,3-bisphosphoglycerate-independent phosphoglycerate mutase, partial [Sphingomonadales bacterium]
MTTEPSQSSVNAARVKPAIRPVVLCILDGWGYRAERENNAIALANTPVYDRLWRTAPRGWLQTSGLAVGLPEGQMGNSEVGHMNLGSGRVVMQDLPRIDKAIADNDIPGLPAWQKLVAALRQSGGACHLMGLLSDGGVHSHQNHMAALARLLAAEGIPVRIHAFLDGRDTPPKSALEFLARFERDIAGLDDCRIVSVSGRYYAMDRDKRWDRVQQAYDVIAKAVGARAASAAEAINESYGRDATDEFVQPTVIGDYAGMKDGDGLLTANFRADRAREILTALVDPEFDGFDRGKPFAFAARVGMVDYSTALAPYMDTLFPSLDLKGTLGETVAAHGLRQLRTAETEKYAHVTFFFNGGVETPFEGEDRILVPSPKVATYDLKPEMSAGEVTDNLVKAIRSEEYDLIVVNYANPDMVGHTGILSAAIKAAETVDHCLGRLEEALKEVGGVMLVTADHGNLEMMVDPDTAEPYT